MTYGLAAVPALGKPVPAAAAVGLELLMLAAATAAAAKEGIYIFYTFFLLR